MFENARVGALKQEFLNRWSGVRVTPGLPPYLKKKALVNGRRLVELQACIATWMTGPLWRFAEHRPWLFRHINTRLTLSQAGSNHPTRLLL